MGKLVILLLLTFSIVPAAARADQVVFSNLGPRGDPSYGLSFGFERAMGLPSAAIPLALSSIELPLVLQPGLTELDVRLYSDSAGLPADLLESIVVAAEGPVTPVYEATLVKTVSALNPVLRAESMYWVSLSVLGGGVADWWPLDGDLGIHAYRSGSGGDWIESPRSDPDEGVSLFRPQVRVMGHSTAPAPIPEPTTVLLLGTGVAACAVRLRPGKKRRRAHASGLY